MTNALDLYQALVNRGAAPAITWYGELGRVELSGKVAANHLAKIAGYLADEVWLDPGSEIFIDLPASYKQVLWGLGAFLAGAHVSIDDADSPASPHLPYAVLTDAPRGSDQAEEVLALDLAPLAFAWRGPALPSGVRDATSEVMGSPDALMDYSRHGNSNFEAWREGGAEAGDGSARAKQKALVLVAPNASQALRAAVSTLPSGRIVVVENREQAEKIRLAEQCER